MIDVSIIIPVYKGNKYINNLLKIITRNVKIVENIKVEVLLINDCPDCALQFQESYVEGYNLHLITNKVNLGIQGSRVEGLRHSSGQYVLFLDQDDIITDNAILTQYKAVQGYDVVIANGYVESASGERHKLYRSFRQQKKAKEISYYYYIGNVITSPGMTLIRRKSIPEVWCNNILKTNGADDWLLWILLFINNASFTINNSYIYTHKYTGVNLSNNTDKMLDSIEEAINILEVNSIINSSQIEICKKRNAIRREIENSNKIAIYARNPRFAFELLKWKYL